MRYELPVINDYVPFAQVSGYPPGAFVLDDGHAADRIRSRGHRSATICRVTPRYDASVGVTKDAWTVQLYGENLTDTRAALCTSSYSAVREDEHDHGRGP